MPTNPAAWPCTTAGLIVAAPARDVIFYVGEESTQAIDALRALVSDVMKKVPAPLSPELLRWTKTGWEPVP
jgi:hypothetical protein